MAIVSSLPYEPCVTILLYLYHYHNLCMDCQCLLCNCLRALSKKYVRIFHAEEICLCVDKTILLQILGTCKQLELCWQFFKHNLLIRRCTDVNYGPANTSVTYSCAQKAFYQSGTNSYIEYCAINRTMTWMTANTTCQSLGYQLAVMDNVNKQGFIWANSGWMV